jgi:peptidoglycan hydrolase-like protein with peptidoglycan-binding domain
VTFRAGRSPDSTAREAGPPFTAFSTPGPSVLLADVSEFQPDISDAAYLAWSEAIVIRAAYGDAHTDGSWYGGQRRELLLEGGARFLGIYQYIVAGQDAAAQARALVSITGGKLNTGEVIIADLEEGAGNQAGRLSAWAHVISSELGDAPWSYSGLWFGQAAGIAPVSWVAAYQAAEPSGPHTVWQFTDAYHVPGVGTCDCSVFHGTMAQLAGLAHGGTKPVPSPTPPQPSAPPFPYPASDYLGLKSPDPHCHSGYYAADQPNIRTWQSQMLARGWTISADGIYGTQSDGVCRAFQQEKNITADGKVGPVTWGESWTSPVT